MTNVYVHDPKLGIHYQEDTDMKLWLIKQKHDVLILFSGTEEDMMEYQKDNEKKIIVIYAFSDLLLDYMNIIGDRKILPILPQNKYVQVGEQVL